MSKFMYITTINTETNLCRKSTLWNGTIGQEIVGRTLFSYFFFLTHIVLLQPQRQEEERESFGEVRSKEGQLKWRQKNTYKNQSYNRSERDYSRS